VQKVKNITNQIILLIVFNMTTNSLPDGWHYSEDGMSAYRSVKGLQLKHANTIAEALLRCIRMVSFSARYSPDYVLKRETVRVAGISGTRRKIRRRGILNREIAAEVTHYKDIGVLSLRIYPQALGQQRATVVSEADRLLKHYMDMR